MREKGKESKKAQNRMFEFGGQFFIALLPTQRFLGSDVQGMGPGHTQEPTFSKSEPAFTHVCSH